MYLTQQTFLGYILLFVYNHSLKLLQITGDFCSWLRELPEGEDQTVNNLTPETIKSLFDSTNSSKLATSKVAQGLQSW